MSASRSLFHTVADGVHVLDPRIGADSMAVIGAMMSRAPDLGRKFEQVAQGAELSVNDLIEATVAQAPNGFEGAPGIMLHPDALREILQDFVARQDAQAWDFRNPPEKVRSFLEQNLAGYGHASIGSMAKAAFVYLHGFGWPAAWLLEDTPLFDGQEVSTRAVDASAIPGAHGPGTICRYAPEGAGLERLHERWMAVYQEVKAEARGGGWKYDDARVYLPGTIPTGVVLTNDVRAIARQLDHIRGLGGAWEQLAAQGYVGLEACAPVTTAAIGHKTRRPLGQWAIGRTLVGNARSVAGADAGDFVRVTQWDQMPAGMEWADFGETIEPRTRPNTYLDPMWKRAPRFKFEVTCSLAIARDWHRHRPLMPWSLDVVTTDRGDILLAPWYQMEQRVTPKLLQDTQAAFRTLGGLEHPMSVLGRGIPGAQQWAAMHALPFGTLVRLSCVATLPELVYMLELRATTKGANPEYRAQALEGLRQLCLHLPAPLVREEQLDGALQAASGANAMHPV